MSQKYFTTLTHIGAALHANAQLQQTTVAWTHLVLGDGNGAEPVPSPAQTGVIREVDRLPISSIEPDPDNPSWIVIEAVIPADRGGYVVRETALMGGANGASCIAVGNYPPATKPLLSDGAGSELVIRVVVEIAHTATVTLKIDPAVVIASRKFVEDTLAKEMARISAGHMFETNHWQGARSALPQGWFAMDGIQITELLVPGIREALVASGHDMVTEAEWQADPLKRGQWSSGAAGWVRMPDWNGVQGGSIGGLYFSGDLGGSRRGNVVADAMRNLRGELQFRTLQVVASANPANIVAAGDNTQTSNGVFSANYNNDANPEGAVWSNSLQSVENTYSRKNTVITLDASATVPTADEFRPKSVYGTWIIRLYGGYTHLGSLNSAALLSEINALKTRASQLEASGMGVVKNDVLASRGFAIIYTNTSSDRARRCYLSMTAVAGGFVTATVDGDEVATAGKQAAGACGITFDVPPLKAYRVDASGMTLTKWKEQ